MRETLVWSPSATITLFPSLRLVLGAFEVRMCRVFVWPRLILPVPVLLNRLAAPRWVFNLGIVFSFCAEFCQAESPAFGLKDRAFPHHFRLA